MQQTTSQHWHAALDTWLGEQDPDRVPARQVWDIGRICAWRRYPDGHFGPEDIERGLLLYEIIQARRAQRALQLHTGRGFECAVMARAAADAGRRVTIDTVDDRPADLARPWPFHEGDSDRSAELSVTEVFSRYFPAAQEVVHHHSGTVHRKLHQLLKDGARYGLIAVHAGDDSYDLLKNVCYCIPMLEDDGALVITGLTPTARSGLGPIMFLPHLRRLFVDVHVLRTGGRVWPLSQPEDAWSGAVLASGHRFPEWRLHRSYLLYWRLLFWMLRRAYTKAGLFPLKPDVD